MTRIVADASATIQRLYAAQADRLFAYALGLTGSRPEAEDALHDVFAGLLRQPGVIERIADPAAYLARAVKNRALDGLRRRYRREAAFDYLAATASGVALPDAALERGETLAAVRAALGALDAATQETIFLRIQQGMAFEAVAAVLQEPLGTVTSRYWHGIDRVRQALREHHHA